MPYKYNIWQEPFTDYSKEHSVVGRTLDVFEM